MGDGPPGFPRDSTCPVVLGYRDGSRDVFRLRGYHPLWPSVPGPSPRHAIGNSPDLIRSLPHNPQRPEGLRVWADPLSFATTDGIDSLFFPRLTEMFHFRRSRLSAPILFRAACMNINPCGLPHSEITGSQPACGYPVLIAAYHVLHRLLVPRHPLCAL